MLHEHYLELIDETARLVAEVERTADSEAGERVTALLRHVDLVHREGLLRLVEALRAHGAGPLLDGIIADDPVVRIVLGLYGLADLELGPEDESGETGASTDPAPREHQRGFFPIEQLKVRRTGTVDP